MTSPPACAEGTGFIETAAEGIRLRVRVQPRASRPGIEGTVRDADDTLRLRIRVGEPPEDGRANKAVAKLIAKSLGVATGRVHVVAGERAAAKTVQVDGEPGPLARLAAERLGGSR